MVTPSLIYQERAVSAANQERAVSAANQERAVSAANQERAVSAAKAGAAREVEVLVEIMAEMLSRSQLETVAERWEARVAAGRCHSSSQSPL